MRGARRGGRWQALTALCSLACVHGRPRIPLLAELLPPHAPPLRASQQCLHPTERASVASRSSPSAYAYDLVVAMLSVRDHETEIKAQRPLSRVSGPCSILHVLIFADGSLPAPRAVRTGGDGVDLTVATVETYGNLPAKVLAAFDWINSHVAFKYVLKTDDDTAVCVGGLLRALAPLPRAALYWGKLRAGGLRVELSGKWADTGYAAIFGTPTYGDYAFGAGYMLSHDLVREAVARVSGLAAAMRVEDGLIGAALLGVGALEVASGTAVRASVGRTGPSAAQTVELVVRARWEPVAGARAPRAPEPPEDAGAVAFGGGAGWLPPVASLGRWATLSSPARVHVVNTSAVIDRSPHKSRTLGEATLARLCGSRASATVRWSAQARMRYQLRRSDGTRSGVAFADVRADAIMHTEASDDERPAQRAIVGVRGDDALVVHRLWSSSLRRCVALMHIQRRCGQIWPIAPGNATAAGRSTGGRRH